ncbi:MAG: hypothetical protein JOZ72_15295 [Alphaproteobacteria bacterium]|nr:hypothetical protein [Alphaproteobacteria bacterium]
MSATGTARTANRKPVTAVLAYAAMFLFVWAAGTATLPEVAVASLPVGLAGAASGFTMWRLIARWCRG